MKSKQLLKTGSRKQGFLNKPALLLCILIITCTIANYPQSNFLRQNYPNPASDKTTIEYFYWNDQEIDSHYIGTDESEMTIYNSIGELVWRSNWGNREPWGGHAIYFDTSKLPNGFYVCTLRYGSYSESIKMLVLHH